MFFLPDIYPGIFIYVCVRIYIELKSSFLCRGTIWRADIAVVCGSEELRFQDLWIFFCWVGG